MRRKVLFFTGAGIDKESGIETFRDNGGLWNNYKVEEVATIDGWETDRKKVLDFYNERRKQLKNVEPNIAHKIIASLEKDFDVTVVTQNVTDLHERAGSTNVIHLHGELKKVRSTVDSTIIYDWSEDCNIGDKCKKGSQLRPHIVWFGESLNHKFIERTTEIASECDICVIVGTSMQVAPANSIPFLTKDTTLIYYIDPSDINFNIPYLRKSFFYHFKDIASNGMIKLENELKEIFL